MPKSPFSIDGCITHFRFPEIGINLALSSTDFRNIQTRQSIKLISKNTLNWIYIPRRKPLKGLQKRIWIKQKKINLILLKLETILKNSNKNWDNFQQIYTFSSRAFVPYGTNKVPINMVYFAKDQMTLKSYVY